MSHDKLLGEKRHVKCIMFETEKTTRTTNKFSYSPFSLSPSRKKTSTKSNVMFGVVGRRKINVNNQNVLYCKKNKNAKRYKVNETAPKLSSIECSRIECNGKFVSGEKFVRTKKEEKKEEMSY